MELESYERKISVDTFYKLRSRQVKMAYEDILYTQGECIVFYRKWIGNTRHAHLLCHFDRVFNLQHKEYLPKSSYGVDWYFLRVRL